MTNCTKELFKYPAFDRRKIEASFGGGEVSSDAGIMLLSQVDEKLGLTKALDGAMQDPRNPYLITHEQRNLIKQRVYGIALGYEDLNDHDTLRKDLAWQTAMQGDEELASSPTLCRLEGRADRKTAVQMHKIFAEQFIASFKEAPKELILDFDATDDRIHGDQVGRSFHAYYGDWCFLPLYVFCGDQLLVSYLRKSNIDAAQHSWAILSLLTKRLRQQWPKVKIIFRGDSGFCRWKMFRWCEKNNVDYIVGIARNARLQPLLEPQLLQAKSEFAASQQKARRFTWLSYKAESWDKARCIIGKAEHTSKGSNPRFVITSLRGDAQKIYDTIYCQRGEMENRIKEQQLGLFADRTSCHEWWANQFRLLLSSAAYLLVEAIRRLGLHGTELAHAQASTIRLKLLKIGVVVLRNTRRIQLLMSSAFPYQEIFSSVFCCFSTS
jgi:hypothetical protein